MDCIICYKPLGFTSYCFCNNQLTHRVCKQCLVGMRQNETPLQCPMCRQKTQIMCTSTIIEKDIRLLQVKPITSKNRIFMYMDRPGQISNFSTTPDVSIPTIDIKLIADCHVVTTTENKKQWDRYVNNKDIILRTICEKLQQQLAIDHSLHDFKIIICADHKDTLFNIVSFTFKMEQYDMNLSVRLNNIIGPPEEQKKIIDNMIDNKLCLRPRPDEKIPVPSVNYFPHSWSNHLAQHTLQLEIRIIQLAEQAKYSVPERFASRQKKYPQ